MSLKIRRLFGLILVLFIMLQTVGLASPSDYNKSTPELLDASHLYGEACVILDAQTGNVLFTKNSRVRMFPASTTKIMTALLAIESGVDFNTPVTIPPEAGDIPADSSLVPIFKGEITTFGDLLYGLMLHSGNDAANAVAVLIAGSIPAFVDRMNARAAELGCIGTHFANPHGYQDSNHYTTAMDLALITAEALKYDAFRTIVGTRSYTMHVNPRGDIPLTNTNSLLNPNSTYYYADALGIKTGTTSAAGKCFVGAAEKDGVTLVTVTLGGSADEGRWIDSIRMFNHGFTRYTGYTLEQMFDLTDDRIATFRVSNAKSDDPYGGLLSLNIAQVSDTTYRRMIETNNDSALADALDDFTSRSVISITDDLTAPISAGEIIGSYTYAPQNGTPITAMLIASRDIEAQPEKTTIFDVFPFLRYLSDPLFLLLILLVILLIVTLVMYGRIKKRRRAKRRRQLYERRRREYLRQQRQQAAERNANRSRNPERRRR